MAVMIGVTGGAVADPVEDRTQQARAAADQGAARFHDRDYAGAVERFKAAYDLNRDASYLFNIAQAYRHAGDCVNSAEYYRRFLAEVPNPPNVERIREWYTDQQKCAEQRGGTAPRDRPDPVPHRPAPTTPPRDTPSLVVPLVVGGVGVVALAVGGGFLVRASNLASERDRLLADCSLANPCSADLVTDLDRRGSRANTLGAVSLGIGVVAVAAGATLWALSRRRSPVTIVPADRGAAVTAAWSW